jgi:hypothetical protein
MWTSIKGEEITSKAAAECRPGRRGKKGEMDIKRQNKRFDGSERRRSRCRRQTREKGSTMDDGLYANAVGSEKRGQTRQEDGPAWHRTATTVHSLHSQALSGQHKGPEVGTTER